MANKAVVETDHATHPSELGSVSARKGSAIGAAEEAATTAAKCASTLDARVSELSEALDNMQNAVGANHATLHGEALSSQVQEAPSASLPKPSRTPAVLNRIYTRAEQEELLMLLGESDISVQKLREELRFVYASIPDGAAGSSHVALRG